LEVGVGGEALARALEGAQPAICHRAQGAQLTSHDVTRRFEAAGIQSRMDGRGRALENSVVERRWRTVTDEAV
jgi:transposase InsO family protein